MKRASRESATLVTVDREAHFRSFAEQAKVVEYHGNVKILYKLTREAAGQPRIKPVPSIMVEDNITVTVSAAQTNERWRQYFAKLPQGRVTELADLRARSFSWPHRAGSCLHDVHISEREVRKAIMRKKIAPNPRFR